MTAQDFIFQIAPFKKIDGDEYTELYRELSNERLSVNGFNPIRNVETTYHLCTHAINIGYGPMGQNGFNPVDDNIRCMSFECSRYNNILTILVISEKENR